MSKYNVNMARLFMMTGIVLLLAGLLLGLIAAQFYVFNQQTVLGLEFSQLRPMHVSAVLFWILMGASGAVMFAMISRFERAFSFWLLVFQYACWILTIVGVFYAYLHHSFGGREYWEFPPIYAFPLLLSWLAFLLNFIRVVKGSKGWPVYVWMWMTGIVFFIFTFLESYLWVFPYFRSHFITDMTIQWKANGSLVGSWNQLIYGTSFYLMERISGDKQLARQPLTFAMYFLGLFNLMFNWGHHVYTLPTDAYVKYIGYIVSMTEWIFFIKILYNWRATVSEYSKYVHYMPYRFLVAAEWWVFINMGQAILMSIPAFNLFTHGTHVTVAHAMGTTIGINTMILFGACLEFLTPKHSEMVLKHKGFTVFFWMIQLSLFVFWFSLNSAGLVKGYMQLSGGEYTFHSMMNSLTPVFWVFMIAGWGITIGFIGFVVLYLAKIRRPITP